MRRLTLRFVLAALIVGVFVGPAHGAQLHDDGWWWRAQTGMLVDLPPPPYVPEDGLVVGNGPDGPTAIAAIRFRLDDEETDPTLVLRVHDERGAEPAIVACSISEVWFGDRAGRWEDVPAHDCEAATVVGTPDEDGETWAFALNALVRHSAIDVVLRVPEGTATMFEIVFEAPDDGSLQTRQGNDDFEVPPVESAPDTAPPSTSNDGGAPWETESAPALTFDPSDDHPADQEQEEAPPPVVADEPAPPTDAAPPSESTSEPPPAATAPTAGAAAMNDRLLAALLLAVGLLVLADLAWQKAPASRRLGAATQGPARAAEAPPRGLGRFRRPREGSATPLV